MVWLRAFRLVATVTICATAGAGVMQGVRAAGGVTAYLGTYVNVYTVGLAFVSLLVTAVMELLSTIDKNKVELKADVKELKAELKADVKELKTDVKELSHQIGDVLREVQRIGNESARQQGKVEALWDEYTSRRRSWPFG